MEKYDSMGVRIGRPANRESLPPLPEGRSGSALVIGKSLELDVIVIVLCLVLQFCCSRKLNQTLSGLVSLESRV